MSSLNSKIELNYSDNLWNPDMPITSLNTIHTRNSSVAAHSANYTRVRRYDLILLSNIGFKFNIINVISPHWLSLIYDYGNTDYFQLL